MQEGEPSVFGSDVESLPGDEVGLEGFRMLEIILEVDGAFIKMFLDNTCTLQ